ncbi:hypothetical protein CLM62_12855 [Streptomyces sp. SA15]|uniref:hypothetical protein n=1 Tax=Streptomyces sp. SA15 TaxID=934019 RepID=UPI000BB0C7D4|nr:hypothetical protein [Streptomyces sp. SA15]PAZ15680.1 hypothetical protein CLM62_12855 [Streptomyces sp. SA15]
MPFDLGAVVPLGTTVKDSTGTLANAGSMAVTITLPDATTVSVSPVTPASTGTYTYDYTTVQAGRHVVRWVATGVNAGAYTDSFDVREAAPPGIISLADTKAHLNIPSSTTTHDDELRGWIESVTAGIEHLTGACVRRTVVEVHDYLPVSGARVIALRKTPVISLTSMLAVLDGGTGYTVADLDVDGSTGVVRRKDGGRLYGPLRATYVPGRIVIPANLTHAGKLILQHLWRTQYGASRALPGIGGGEDYAVTEPVPGFGYAIPNRALQLLEPHRLPPGVA